eukprot:1157997-Pelagomonas_calceolata.AAC.8
MRPPFIWPQLMNWDARERELQTKMQLFAMARYVFDVPRHLFHRFGFLTNMVTNIPAMQIPCFPCSRPQPVCAKTLPPSAYTPCVCMSADIIIQALILSSPPVCSQYFPLLSIPLAGVSTDIVGKYCYYLDMPLESQRVPVIVDVALIGRTKIIKLHSALWLQDQCHQAAQNILVAAIKRAWFQNMGMLARMQEVFSGGPLHCTVCSAAQNKECSFCGNGGREL